MLIDINAGFGGRETIQEFTAEMMCAQLKRTPYSLAFIHSHQGMSDTTSANDQTFALCGTDQTLLPAAVIAPRDTFGWREEIARCREHGVRLFRIYPDQGAWPVDSIFTDIIIEELAGTGAVLMVEATTPGLPSLLAERSHGADLPIIFTEARYFPLTELLLLAQRHPAIHIETSRLTSPGGIERCVEVIGPERVVYGSGTGRYPAWVAWQTLQRANISDAERASIAWRNAARLLGLDPASLGKAQTEVAIESTSFPALDVHLHDKFPGAPFRPFSPSEYAAELDRNGVIGGVCSSVTGIFYDLKQGNDEVAALLTAIPSLRGYVVADPRYIDASIRELTRLGTDDWFVGVKIHCSYSRTLTNDRALAALFERIAPYGRPVLIHNLGADWPEALVEIAKRHPDLPIIAAHSGYGDGPHPTHDAANRVASQPNIFIEFCSTYLATGAIRRGIEAVGIDRVLFGSDFPLIALPYMRAAYEDAKLSDAEASAIYRDNALRLFPELEPLVRRSFGRWEVPPSS
jgi:uncharacterized protein